MGMAAILFNDTEPFYHIVNSLSTDSQMWNLVKLLKMVSEKKTFNKSCQQTAQLTWNWGDTGVSGRSLGPVWSGSALFA